MPFDFLYIYPSDVKPQFNSITNTFDENLWKRNLTNNEKVTYEACKKSRTQLTDRHRRNKALGKNNYYSSIVNYENTTSVFKISKKK